MIQELYLIGTVPFDLQGPARLEKLLHHLKPDQITIEMDAERIVEIDYINLHSVFPQSFEALFQRLRQSYPNLHPKTGKQLLRNYGYEYIEAVSYCNVKRASLICIDNFDTVRFEEKNIDLAELLANTPEHLQQRAENIYQGIWPELENKEEKISVMEFRDTLAAQKIRSCQGKVVHIGDMRHLNWEDDYFNLARRLYDLNPIRVRLNQAEQLK